MLFLFVLVAARLPAALPQMSRLSVNLSSIRFWYRQATARRIRIGKTTIRGIRSVRQDERQGASATLADFVAATSWADVAAQSHEAKRSILNFFATALGSAQ